MSPIGPTIPGHLQVGLNDDDEEYGPPRPPNERVTVGLNDDDDEEYGPPRPPSERATVGYDGDDEEYGPPRPPSKRATVGLNDDDEEYGPPRPRNEQPTVGPQLPPHVQRQPLSDTDEFDPPRPHSGRSTVGPQLPPHLQPQFFSDNDDEAYGPAPPPKTAIAYPRPRQPSPASSDDEPGPMPLPASARARTPDPVAEFVAREERRRAAAEEAARPKKPAREEWMLVPPTSSGVLASLDPTKLNKPRHFRASNVAPATDNSLWTETPQQRQARLKGEVEGTRKRAVDEPDAPSEAHKRQRQDDAVRQQVEEYNRQTRGHTLVDMHVAARKDKGGGADADAEGGIWDHARDMSVGGRLMDDGQRAKMLRDARGLGDRFGKGKSGGFL